MALNLTNLYTPGSRQVPNAPSYNTDISLLFNAFIGLEAQTSTLGGLTITPSADNTSVFKVTNASGASIFNIDTTTGVLTGNGSGLTNLDPFNGNIKFDHFERDNTLASGTQSVTGVGFNPSLVIFIATWSNGTPPDILMSIGFDNGTDHVVLGGTFIGWLAQPNCSIGYSSTTSYTGSISSKNNDGFTISWTRNNLASGTLKMMYLAFK